MLYLRYETFSEVSGMLLLAMWVLFSPAFGGEAP